MTTKKKRKPLSPKAKEYHSNYMKSYYQTDKYKVWQREYRRAYRAKKKKEKEKTK